MLYLISYDIECRSKEGRRRLARVARLLERWGVRVQMSVFEVRIAEESWPFLRQAIVEEIREDKDSVRVYPLNQRAEQASERLGSRGPKYLFGGYLV